MSSNRKFAVMDKNLQNTPQDQMTYHQLILYNIRDFSNDIRNSVIHGQGLEKYQVQGVYVAVRMLHSIISPGISNFLPYHKKVKGEYTKKGKLIKEGIKKKVQRKLKTHLEDKDKRFDFLDELLDWFEEITAQFGSLGLVPAQHESLSMEDKETAIRKKYLLASRLAFNLLTFHRKEIIDFLDNKKLKSIDLPKSKFVPNFANNLPNTKDTVYTFSKKDILDPKFKKENVLKKIDERDKELEEKRKQIELEKQLEEES